MTDSIGDRSPVVPTAVPSTGGNVRLNVTGQSTPEDMAEALGQYGLEEASAKAYAGQVGTIQSKESRTRLFQKVEAKMNDFIKNHPNATQEEIAKEAKKHLMAQTLMYKHVEKSIMDMAQQSIARIRDTFSENE